MRKWYHFIEKPDIRYIRTAQEIRNEETQKTWFLLYSLFFFSFFGFVSACSMWMHRDSLPKLHAEICEHASNSPLCRDFHILERVDIIAKKKGVPTRLIVGIWNAESTLGTHFNKTECGAYSNWAGLKGRKFDDGHVEWYAKNRKKPDKQGCWLYKFDSLDQATESLANTIAVGYRGCENKTECIAYAFVGHPDIAEISWIGRVEKFYKSAGA